ncbi:Peptidase lipoprotein, M48 family [Chitinispirillum alkaliphilum]|nr:Peptidase lipoprotein, M48 family [Chitinispirillum alkaliphilum]
MKSILPFCFFLLIFPSCQNITYFFISDQAEVELGRQVKRVILSDNQQFPEYTANESLIRYVDSIGQALVEAQQDRKEIGYTFALIDNPDIINAFALPGGFVFVYTGLIKAARNEAELAGVLAHEIGHITKRHGIKRLIQTYGAGLLLEILISEDAQVTRKLSEIAAKLAFLQYGRSNEYEADSVAVEYMHLAGYNPTGMQTFLELLNEYTQESSPVMELFSTHPDTERRIERVERIISRLEADLPEEELYESRFIQYRELL